MPASSAPIPEQIRNVLAGTQDMHLLFPEFLTNLIGRAQSHLGAVPVQVARASAGVLRRATLFKPALDKLRCARRHRARRRLDLVADGSARPDLGAADQDAGRSQGPEAAHLGIAHRHRDLAGLRRQYHRGAAARNVPRVQAGHHRGRPGDDRHRGRRRKTSRSPSTGRAPTSTSRSSTSWSTRENCSRSPTRSAPSCEQAAKEAVEVFQQESERGFTEKRAARREGVRRHRVRARPYAVAAKAPAIIAGARSRRHDSEGAAGEASRR